MNQKDQIKQLKEENEHYKLYFKSWQRARKMIKDVLEDKSLTKEEKEAINTIFNTMTLAIDEEVKK